MNIKNKIYDAIVLGKGPLGVYTSKFLSEQNIKVLNIDAGIGQNELKNKTFVNSNVNWRGIEQMPSLDSSISPYSWTGACMGWPKEDLAEIPIDQKELTQSQNSIKNFFDISNFDFGSNKPTYKLNYENENLVYAKVVKDVQLLKNQKKLNNNKNYIFLDNTIAHQIKFDNNNISLICRDSDTNEEAVYYANKLYLCLGGIENTRLLLQSSELSINRNFLGNNLSDHLALPVTKILSFNFQKDRNKFDYIPEDANFHLWPKLVNNKDLSNKKRYSGYTTEFKKLIYKLGTYYLNVYTEKGENKSTNISLDKENLQISFYVDEKDLSCISNATKTFTSTLKKNGLKISYRKISNNDILQNIDTGKHPSGTTRMSLTPDDGVVNKYSQLWKHNNIFVFGSSTFPKSSYIHPTFPALSFAYYALKNT